MKAEGTTFRGYDLPSDHPAWETVRSWTKKVFTRKNLTVAVATAIGLLLFGLMIWLFYQSLETLTSAEFPNDLRLYLF
jgi:hypothetical protein